MGNAKVLEAGAFFGGVVLLGLFELSLSSLLELFSSTTFLPILLSLSLFGSSLLTRDADLAFGFPGAVVSSLLWLLLLSQSALSTDWSLLFASSFSVVQDWGQM